MGKKRKTAKDFGDKTPADYDAAKRRSISQDRKKAHSKEPWEVRYRKMKRKK